MADQEDSRTALAGRKRDFEEVASSEELRMFEGEPPRKRTKDDGDSSGFAPGDVSVADVSSETPVPTLADEVAGLSRLPAIQSGSVFNMLKEGEELQLAAAPEKSTSSSTWNGGVASGLRTSFGSKAKGKAKALSQVLDDDVQMGTTESAESSRTLTRKEMGNVPSTRGMPDKLGLEEHPSQVGAPQLSDQTQPSLSSSLNFEPPQHSDSEDDDNSSGSEDDNEAEEGINHESHNDTPLQIPQSSSLISEEVLAAAGAPPIRPPVFIKLTKAQLQGRSKSQKQAYSSGRDAYKKAMIEYETAQREYNTKLGYPNQFEPLPPDFRDKPRLLKPDHVRRLSRDDQSIYHELLRQQKLARRKIRKAEKEKKRKAKREEKRPPLTAKARAEMVKIDKIHNQAVQVIEKQWPLSARHQTMTTIGQGKTWFPAINPNQEVRTFGVKAYKLMIEFVVPVVTWDDGTPIAVQDISFNAFVLPFLAANKTIWEALTDRKLKLAFDHYLDNCYPHAIKYHPDRRDTSLNPDATKLEEAKKKVEEMLGTTISSTPAIAQSTLALPSRRNMTGGQRSRKEANPATIKSSISEAPRIVESHDAKQITAQSSNHDEGEVDIIMNASPKPISYEIAPEPMSAAIEDSDFRKALIILQDKYYPSPGDEIRCLSCAQIGHTSSSCPTLSCANCGTRGHSTLMCPRDMLCEKCRARNHSIGACPEKLSIPRDEMTCDICGAESHLETECPRIWRSYEPPNQIIRVSGIPVYCFSCGDADHYGPDCNMYQGPGIFDTEYTFKATNLFRYLDQNSQHRAISAGVDYSIPQKSDSDKGYKIKGKSKGKQEDPISLDDSEDEEFIRPSVKSGNVSRGNITFGSGKPPQAPFRSGEENRNQVTIPVRGRRRGRGGGRGEGRGEASQGVQGGRPNTRSNTSAPTQQPKKPRAEKRAFAREAQGSRR